MTRDSYCAEVGEVVGDNPICYVIVLPCSIKVINKFRPYISLNLSYCYKCAFRDSQLITNL